MSMPMRATIIPSDEFCSVDGVGFVGVEMKNVAYSKADYLIGTTFLGQDKSNNTIEAVEEVPEFVQYTGKVLTSKKLTTDLPISDVDSVIIRINMVKGM